MSAHRLLLATALALSLHPGLAAAQGKAKPVTWLYSLDRSKLPHLAPVVYTPHRRIGYVFAVPERGAVGTNSLDNGIGIVTLGAGEARYRSVRRNFMEGVAQGEIVFLPHFSSDTIGYSQTRGFLLFNVKDGSFKDLLIGRMLGETITDVAVLDWERRLFLFNIEYVPGLGRTSTELRLVDLSGPAPKVVASRDLGERVGLVRLGRTTFYYLKDGERRVLHALDERLEPVAHPVVVARSAAGLSEQPGEPVLHPSLSLAVFSAFGPRDNASVWAVEWRTDPARPRLIPLFEGVSGGFRFSPDGRWMLFNDTTGGGPEALIAMPVDPALPHLLGPPILLRTELKVPDQWNGNCAWIADPVGVACLTRDPKSERPWDDPNWILKWELPASRPGR